ncbi:MAG: hypothetical protein HWE18_11995 [Gammaproteobacteria bacterium]|nr:hypothetical protein [Gammaproteobacteria bacterium]
MVSAQQRVGIEADILAASPAMAIDDIESSWENPSNGRYAQARGRLSTYLEMSAQFTLGVQRRWDYLLGFSQETAQFYSRLENNQIEDGTYALDFSVNAAQSDALFAQYFIPLSFESSLEVTAYLLKGERMQDGRLTGEGNVQGSNLSYDWQLDYAYDENRLFDSGRDSLTGWGHSFDLAFSAQINPDHLLKVAVKDLFYAIYWQDVPQDKGCLNRPLSSSCSVYSSRQQHTQIFPAFVRTQWLVTQQNHTYRFAAEAWHRYTGLLMGWGYEGFAADVDVMNEKLNIGYESSWLKVKWGLDNLNASEAKHWQLNLDVNWPIL